MVENCCQLKETNKYCKIRVHHMCNINILIGLLVYSHIKIVLFTEQSCYLQCLEIWT